MVSVAIIIPVYITTERAVGWLHECLESCTGQADEIIVWDDSSKLSIDSVVEDFPDATLLGGQHRGKSYARNMAVKHSHSDLIYPVDADDWIKSNAIATLLAKWDGTPLYSDIIKVHAGGIEKVFPLLPFDCEVMQVKCISSINVLHSKEQWERVGGWDEYYNLFEDWLYNSKLFWLYCANKVRVPLVYYRQHAEQSTFVAPTLKKGRIRLEVLSLIEEFVEKGNESMAPCCGKRRLNSKRSGSMATRTVTNMTVAPTVTLDLSMEVDLAPLGDPGPGNIWARYVDGRGMGPHDRRALKSRKKYKQVQYAGIYAIKAVDAVSREAFERGAPSGGMVALKLRPEPAPPPAPVVVKRMPIKAIKREPLIDKSLEEYRKQLESLSISEIRDVIGTMNLTHDDIATFLAAEKSRSKPRVGAVKLLEKAMATKLAEV